MSLSGNAKTYEVCRTMSVSFVKQQRQVNGLDQRQADLHLLSLNHTQLYITVIIKKIHRLYIVYLSVNI